MFKNIIKLYSEKESKFSYFINKYFSDLTLLIIRFNIALALFVSGIEKYNSWFTTKFIFKNLYNITFLNPVFMAVFTTGTEILTSIFLMIGLFSRIFSVISLFTILLLNFAIPESYEHSSLALQLLVIFSFGAGKYSISNYLRDLCAR